MGTRGGRALSSKQVAQRQALAVVLVVIVLGTAVGVLSELLPGAPSKTCTVAAGSVIQLRASTGVSVEVVASQLADPAPTSPGLPVVAGERYVAVVLSVANQGVEPYVPDARVDVQAQDAAGHAVGSVVASAAGTALGSVPADGSASGLVTFEVPVGERVARVEYAVDGVGSVGGEAGVWTFG